jgi:hypothetical protein
LNDVTGLILEGHAHRGSSPNASRDKAKGLDEILVAHEAGQLGHHLTEVLADL